MSIHELLRNAIIDYSCAKECCNDDNTMKYVCWKCGKCGRVFDGQIMISTGGTTSAEEEEE